MANEGSRIVIAAYKPRAGKEAALRALIEEHVPILRRLGLATDRPVIICQSSNGTFIEVFEWVSAQAIERAHTDPEVGKLWKRFDELSEHQVLSSLPEVHDLFAEFTPLT